MVRIWAVPVSELDRQHLFGEHAELNCIVGALLGKYKAHPNHPETLCFQNRIEQLYYRYDQQEAEMQKRTTTITRHYPTRANLIFRQKTNTTETTQN